MEIHDRTRRKVKRNPLHIPHFWPAGRIRTLWQIELSHFLLDHSAERKNPLAVNRRDDEGQIGVTSC